MTAPSLLPAGTYSGPVLDEGTRAVLRDVVRMPATAASPPLARIGILREAPDGSGRLFANDLRGELYVIENGAISVWMDLAALRPDFNDGNLQLGLVSFDFHPDFASNGLFYTTHTEDPGSIAPNIVPPLAAPLLYHAIVTEWRADDPTAATFSGTSRELLRIYSPHPTHNLGEIAFDPTQRPGDADYGLLYIANGDYGSVQRRDPAQVQRLDTVYGAILRIDPLGGPFERNGETYGYGFPASNPFAGDGDPDTFGEIYAYGFRNPQNFHFDRERRGLLYVMEIGQGNLEEVNLPFAGANHGWPEREGTWALDVDVNREVVFALPADDADFGYTYPPVQYDHDEGIAIAGGLAVRGGLPSALTGKFVFGDIVTGRLLYADIEEMLAADDGDPATTASVYGLELLRDGASTTLRQVIRDALQDQGINRADLRFSTDADGRLYLTTKQDGWIRELVPLPRVLGSWLYAPTGELADGVTSCYALLAHLGGAGSVTTIRRPAVGAVPAAECGYQAGTPTGTDFTLELGRAYEIALAAVTEIEVGSPTGCPSTELSAGVNLVGVGAPPIGFGCHDMLMRLGTDDVASIERLDKFRDTFEACSVTPGGTVVGPDFPIRPGEGYLVHSRAVLSVDLNDPAHPACQ